MANPSAIISKENMDLVVEYMFKDYGKYDLGDTFLFLYSFARSLKEPTILELGTGAGQSTTSFVIGCLESKGNITTIDVNNVKKEVLENMNIDYPIKFVIGDTKLNGTFEQVKDLDVGYTLHGIAFSIPSGTILKAQYKTDNGTLTVSEFNIIIDGISEARVI